LETFFLQYFRNKRSRLFIRLPFFELSGKRELLDLRIEKWESISHSKIGASTQQKKSLWVSVSGYSINVGCNLNRGLTNEG